MFDPLLDLNIADGLVLGILSVVSLAFVLYLIARRPTKLWVLTAVVAVLAGALIALLIVFLVVKVWNTFGVDFSPTTVMWIVLTFAAVALALVNLWRSRALRKIIAIVGILMFVLTGVVGVNASIGITKTVGALLGISTAKPLPVPGPIVTPGPTNTGPLYQTWSPPSGMPSTGQVGSIDIPNTVSGFDARQAVAYLPPAYQVENPPQLPVVIQLNGQPGSPSLDDTKTALDAMAAANNGLAPIVINPDQLGGDGSVDRLCLDTSLGKVETYIMQDVVPYVKSHFNVIQDPKYWTFLGFSNGGECAAYFGAKYPETFGNFVDMSGDEYPGVEDSSTAQKLFGGDQAAYEATWPVNIMKRTTYPDSVAVFTVGANDEFKEGIQRLRDAATAAGIKVTYSEIPGAGHDGASVSGGLDAAFTVLYPRWGLKAP